MKKIIITAVLLSTITFLSACAKPEHYIEGFVPEKNITYVYEDTNSVEQKYIFNSFDHGYASGKENFRLSGKDYSVAVAYYEDKKGVYTASASNDKEKTLLFKLPAKKGDITVSNFGEYKTTFKVESVNEKVDTPLKTFKNAIKISYISYDGSGKKINEGAYYYKEGAGLIKKESKILEKTYETVLKEIK
jgi:hypothetical protein